MSKNTTSLIYLRKLAEILKEHSEFFDSRLQKLDEFIENSKLREKWKEDRGYEDIFNQVIDIKECIIKIKSLFLNKFKTKAEKTDFVEDDLDDFEFELSQYWDLILNENVDQKIDDLIEYYDSFEKQKIQQYTDFAQSVSRFGKILQRATSEFFVRNGKLLRDLADHYNYKGCEQISRVFTDQVDLMESYLSRSKDFLSNRDVEMDKLLKIMNYECDKFDTEQIKLLQSTAQRIFSVWNVFQGVASSFCEWISQDAIKDCVESYYDSLGLASPFCEYEDVIIHGVGYFNFFVNAEQIFGVTEKSYQEEEREKEMKAELKFWQKAQEMSDHFSLLSEKTFSGTSGRETPLFKMTFSEDEEGQEKKDQSLQKYLPPREPSKSFNPRKWEAVAMKLKAETQKGAVKNLSHFISESKRQQLQQNSR